MPIFPRLPRFARSSDAALAATLGIAGLSAHAMTPAAGAAPSPIPVVVDSLSCRLEAFDASQSPRKSVARTRASFDVMRKPVLANPTTAHLTTTSSTEATLEIPGSQEVGFRLDLEHMRDEAGTKGLQKGCMNHLICGGPENARFCAESSCGFVRDRDGGVVDPYRDVGLESGVPRFDPTGLFPARMTHGAYEIEWNCRNTGTTVRN